MRVLRRPNRRTAAANTTRRPCSPTDGSLGRTSRSLRTASGVTQNRPSAPPLPHRIGPSAHTDHATCSATCRHAFGTYRFSGGCGGLRAICTGRLLVPSRDAFSPPHWGAVSLRVRDRVRHSGAVGARLERRAMRPARSKSSHRPANDPACPRSSTRDSPHRCVSRDGRMSSPTARPIAPVGRRTFRVVVTPRCRR